MSNIYFYSPLFRPTAQVTNRDEAESYRTQCKYRRQSHFKDGGIEKRLSASYIYRSAYARIFKLFFAIDTCDGATSCARVARVGIAVLSCLHFRRSPDARVFGELSSSWSIYPSHPSWVEYLLLYSRILLSPARRTLVARIASIAARVACRYLVFRLPLETSSRFRTGRRSLLDIIVKIGNKIVFRDAMCHIALSNENSMFFGLWNDVSSFFFHPSRRLIISEKYVRSISILRNILF